MWVGKGIQVFGMEFIGKKIQLAVFLTVAER